MSDVEFCNDCRVEQIQVEPDADYNFDAGVYHDRTAIKTEGAVDGREFGYPQGTYVCASCAAKKAGGLHCSKCARIPKPGSGNNCPCGGRFHDHLPGMYCGPHCPRKVSK